MCTRCRCWRSARSRWLGCFCCSGCRACFRSNPTDVDGVPSALAFNTAASFVTNTNWQNYGGESTMSHLTQMAGLAVQNFVSAAVGIAVAVALVRGLTRRRSATIGNFWVDLTRVTVRVLLPLRRVRARAGEPGRRAEPARPAEARTLEGATQAIYRAPIASQEAIKELGTNGGGIANANSAHPFENPTAFTSLLEIWALLAIPFALAFAFGRLRRRPAAGLGALRGDVRALDRVRPASRWASSSTATRGSTRARRTWRGRRCASARPASGLFAASTTGTSTGRGQLLARQLHAARRRGTAREHDARRGLPGGVGAGLYGMLVFALLAVFIAGLMVGRTPSTWARRCRRRR